MLETELQNLTKSIELLIAKMDAYLKPIHNAGVLTKESPHEPKASMLIKDLKIIHTALVHAGYREAIKSKLSDYGVELASDLKDPLHYKNFCDWIVFFAKKNKVKI